MQYLKSAPEFQDAPWWKWRYSHINTPHKNSPWCVQHEWCAFSAKVCETVRNWTKRASFGCVAHYPLDYGARQERGHRKGCEREGCEKGILVVISPSPFIWGAISQCKKGVDGGGTPSAVTQPKLNQSMNYIYRWDCENEGNKTSHVAFSCVEIGKGPWGP